MKFCVFSVSVTPQYKFYPAQAYAYIDLFNNSLFVILIIDIGNENLNLILTFLHFYLDKYYYLYN